MTNTFSGSCGEFRFMAKPKVVMATPKEVDFDQSSIVCEYWHGKLCYELSEMEGKEEFPMTEEGRLAMQKWLEEHI
jgi:hypothetical protein